MRLLCVFWFAAILCSPAASLRVHCWNIHHGAGTDGRIDLERIAAVIRDAKPDVVALQEVDNGCARSGKVDQAAELARLTGMAGNFGKAMDFQGGAYGQAILSRHPVKASRVLALPGAGEPRIAFEVTIDWQGSDIRVVSTHLGLVADERLAQAKELLRLLPAGGPPTVLCGDFNETLDDPAMQWITTRFKNLPKAAPPFTHPDHDPRVEIDFILSEGFEASGPTVVLKETTASDHRPILVEIKRPVPPISPKK
jgi:endonuclease/exonuclease/phosphatase family metal-dependent hydrolase